MPGRTFPENCAGGQGQLSGKDGGELPVSGGTKAAANRQTGGYSLRLGDGSRWWLGDETGDRSRVEKLAALMQLAPAEPDGDLILKVVRKPKAGWAASLGREGWSRLRLGSNQVWEHSRLPVILWEIDPENQNPLAFHPFFVYVSAFIHRESLKRGGLPFHGALVEKDGRGVILAGPSGTGKSTCCSRIPTPWRALCDDELLVVRTPKGSYLAHPFPTWSDEFFNRGEKPREVQNPVTLGGLFFLEQDREDGYAPIRPSEAAVRAASSACQVMDRLFWVSPAEENRELRRRIFANACDLVKKVPAFRLKVSLTGRFWEKLEAALGWR